MASSKLGELCNLKMFFKLTSKSLEFSKSEKDQKFDDHYS
jgi:hypothetical protein